MGPGGVPVGAKTSEFYRTENVPNRFENPGLWPQNCIYIVYSCHSKCWQRIDSLYSFKNYVKINWIHKISMKLILRFNFDD